MNFCEEANIWPLMDEVGLQALAADIDLVGQQYPVSRFKGSILDGRNRYKAITEFCKVVKTVKFEDVNPTSLIDFVISRNEKRRHLTDSQRGIAGAKALPFFEAEAKKRKSEAQARGVETKKSQTAPIGAVTQSSRNLTSNQRGIVGAKAQQPLFTPQPTRPVTPSQVTPQRAADCAATAFGTSARNIQRGKTVITQGSAKLQTAVETGRLTLGKAEEIVRVYPEKKKQDDQIAKIAASNNITRVKSLTGEYEWYTPRKYLDAAVVVMGNIDLDPASSDAAQAHVKATKFFTLDHDGLQQKWAGRCWLNPPYAMPYIKQFSERMVIAVTSKEIEQAIMLTNNATDTEWFHTLLQSCQACCLTRGRISFLEAHDGELIEKGSPTHGQAFFYFGKNVVKFTKVFSEFGAIVTKIQ